MNASRRRFLIRSGWLAGGITVVAGTGGCSLLPTLPTFGESSEDDIFTWVQLQPDGQIRYYLSRAELGQGISTGLSQVVAEELNVPMSAIDCQHQNTAVMAPCQMTVGSQSIENYLTLTARSAAFLRETLRARAAARYEIATTELTLDAQGGFRLPTGNMLPYTALLADGEVSISALPMEIELELFSERPANQRRLVGKEVEPVHALSIVTGSETYSRDVQVAGLHYGVVARPPQLGVSIIGFDREAALKVTGVKAVVAHNDQLGVVASTPTAAEQGLQALAVSWSRLTAAELAAVSQSLDIDDYLRNNALDHTGESSGSVSQGSKQATQRFSERYDSPMVAHAAMEPRSGVAHCHNNGQVEVCEIWTGSQDPWMVRSAAARALGVDDAQVQVQNLRVGGGFGGRVLCQASVEAAWLSQGSGVPVKVQWTREEEFAHNYVGPQFSTRIDAGLDSSGKISHWHHQAVGAPILTSSMFVPPHLHWVANLVADPGTARGMNLPYDISNRALAFADERVPMPTGPWRGLGAAPNTFAVECAMDELAHLGEQDPIAFRLRHLSEPRLSQCLNRLNQRLGADAPEYGVAAAAYKGVTFVAVAAKVEIVESQPRVSRLICVHDCGRMISPDQVRAQIEGNLVWGIGMALSEKFQLDNGITTTNNFDRYAIPRNVDVPDIDIELVASELPPSGAAEAAIAPAAAAIANALYTLTGQRVRQLPLTLDA